jgi:hypothetical protein
MSYLAGVFDGEGCVSISKKRSYLNGETERPIYYNLMLQIQMTDPSIPRLFQATFGGNISTWMDKSRTRPIHRWRLPKGLCKEAIECLLPYTILKTPQLEVALHFIINTKRRKEFGWRNKLTEEELALREADLILCKNLKKEVL